MSVVAPTTPPSGQPMRQVVSATSDGSGNITFVFQPAPATTWYTGAVQVPGCLNVMAQQSNQAAVIPTFQAWLGVTGALRGTPLGSWAGTSTSGWFQCLPGECISVVGQLLPPNTAFQCSYVGYASAEVDSSIIPAIPNPTAAFAGPLGQVIAGPQPSSFFVSAEGAGAPGFETPLTATGPVLIVLLAAPGVGHAWRLFYASYMGLLSTADTHELGIATYIGSSAQGATEMTFAGHFEARISSSLVTATVATPNPVIPTPAGFVLPDNKGLCLFYFNPLSTTALCTCMGSILYSLDH